MRPLPGGIVLLCLVQSPSFSASSLGSSIKSSPLAAPAYSPDSVRSVPVLGNPGLMAQALSEQASPNPIPSLDAYGVSGGAPSMSIPGLDVHPGVAAVPIRPALIEAESFATLQRSPAARSDPTTQAASAGFSHFAESAQQDSQASAAIEQAIAPALAVLGSDRLQGLQVALDALWTGSKISPSRPDAGSDLAADESLPGMDPKSRYPPQNQSHSPRSTGLFPSRELYKLVDATAEDIHISPLEAEAIREKHDSFYVSAKEFASTYGLRLARILESRLHKGQKTTLVVAMGGAEHSGRLMQIYFSRVASGYDVDLRFVPLQTWFVRPWAANKMDARGRQVSAQDGWPIQRVGIGEIPKGYTLDGLHRWDKPQELRAYLSDKDIFSSGKLIILDTGMRGAIPESVAYAARANGFQGPIEGVMLAHFNHIEHTIPMFSVDESLAEGDTLNASGAAAWASRLDYNNSRGLRDSPTDEFQRSVETSRSDATGRIQAISRLLNGREETWNYRSTLQGLEDGLSEGLGLN